MFKGLGSLANMASLLKQAQELQGKIQEAQERIRAEGSAGGGMVTVQANGQLKVLGMRIDPSLLESNDRELLEDLLVAATNQALEKAKEAAAREVQQATGDLNIPGLGEAMSKFGFNQS